MVACSVGRSQAILDQIVWADDFRGNWNSIFNPEIETDEDDNIIFGVTFLGYKDNFIAWRGDTIVKEDSLLGKRVCQDVIYILLNMDYTL